MKSENQKKDYKWVIVVLCFIMVFTTLGFCSSNKALYLSAITEALNIKRSAFAFTDSCRYVTTATVNLFFGALVSKYGTRKLIGAGFLSLIASCLAFAIGTNVFMFYLAGALLGLGLSWTTTTMVGCIVGRWCKENKGTIMGFILCANGLGGALAAQIISPIIFEEGNPFGYRNAYFLVTVILLVVGTIVVFFFREAPVKQADAEVSSSKKKSRGQSWSGIDYKEAVRKPYFYLMLVCIFFTGLMLQGINGVAAVHMKDVGLDTGYVATILSIHSLSLAAFKFLTGVMYDRYGLRVTMSICDGAAVVIMLLLAFLTNSGSGRIMAFGYAILGGLALPLETIMLPIFANDLFGDRSYEKIMGLFVSVNTAGFAAGSPLMNWTFDHFGSYKPIFLVCAIIMILVLISSQFVVHSAARIKQCYD